MDDLIPTIRSKHEVDPEKGKSRLLSPNPARVKYVTELLSALADRKITFATVMRMDKKKLTQLAEQGHTKLRFGRYNDARKIFEILAFVDHKNYYFHLALAGAYQKMKQYIDAAFQYTECLKYDPNNTNALVNRGEIFLKHRNYKKAAEDFRAAIVLDTGGRDVFANRARSLVIAIKRCIAREKGDKDAKLPNNPSRRKKVKPVSLLSRAKTRKSKK